MLTLIELAWVHLQCAWYRSEIQYVERQITEVDYAVGTVARRR